MGVTSTIRSPIDKQLVPIEANEAAFQSQRVIPLKKSKQNESQDELTLTVDKNTESNKQEEPRMTQTTITILKSEKKTD